MSLLVRAERAGDAAAVRDLLLAAFPTPAEADLVDRLRQDGDAEIALVAEVEGEIVGQLLLSRMKATGDGVAYRALGLGPVAVRSGRQRQGIGAAMIEKAIDWARTQSEEIVFVLGEPAYYRRFGFRAQAARPFDSPYAGPFLMALALTAQPLPERGRADHAPAFAALG